MLTLGQGARLRRQFKVFRELLALVPGLQARLADADRTSDEEVNHIAGMVFIELAFLWHCLTLQHSFRKVRMAPVLMILRA